MRSLGAAAAIAWLGLWFHDAREFSGSAGLTGDSLPMAAIVAALVLFAWRRPRARSPYAALLVYGLIMLVGGALSVLPLPILPFVPPQTLSHYLTHVVYAAAQLPLIALSAARLRSVGPGSAGESTP